MTAHEAISSRPLGRLGRQLAELYDGASTKPAFVQNRCFAATGWDLCGAPPAKLDWHAVHLFRLSANGAPSVEALNVR